MKNEFPDAELERRLTEALAKLPDAPVAFNFTACVMTAIDLEESRARRKWRFSWHSFLPRIAFAAIAVGFAGFAFHQYEINNQRQQIANSVALVATQVPSVEALKNFDAIRRMSQPAHADDELLALYQ